MPVTEIASDAAQTGFALPPWIELTVLQRERSPGLAVLRRGRHALTVFLEGQRLEEPAPRFRILQNDPAQALAQSSTLRLLGDMLAPDPPAADRGVAWQRLRAALLAVDGDAEGLTYRGIAIRIFGTETVDASWSDIDRVLKNRTIRAVQRGRRLVAGAYRKLLS